MGHDLERIDLPKRKKEADTDETMGVTIVNASWDKSIAFVLDQEGGWGNDPNDSGGETVFGISRNNWPKWDGWSLVDALKGTPGFPDNVNQNPALLISAKNFYQKEFWQACQCDSLPWPIDLCVFDTAVNEGIGEAGRILQILVEVTADGDIGDVTITATFKKPPTAKRYLMKRLTAYTRVIMAKPNDMVFADDWHKRVLDLFQVCLI